jgi:hypothetical protein
MEQSILKSTKKILGIGEDDASFDLDIITHINTAFSHLHQLGVGPDAGFEIEDDTLTWADFLDPSAVPNVVAMTNAVKTNVHLRVRSLFDPPQQWHIMNSLQNQLVESDSRVSMMREQYAWVDPTPPPVNVIDGGDPSVNLPPYYGEIPLTGGLP